MYKTISDIGDNKEVTDNKEAPQGQRPPEHVVRALTNAIATALAEKNEAPIEEDTDSEPSQESEDTDYQEDDEWDTFSTLVASHLELCRSFSRLVAQRRI